jgi:hypothetical protein
VAFASQEGGCFEHARLTDVYPKGFLYLTQAFPLLRTIPAGMARYPLEERPHEEFSSEDVEHPPEDLSSEEREEVREAGAVLMLAGAMLIGLAVLMAWPFA